MSVTSVDKDLEALTFTLVAELQAPVDRVWELWADPRRLERWWGPPSHPATVQEHELRPGGRVTYFMTGPEGDRYHAWMDVLAVDPPRSLRVREGFADDRGARLDDMPTTTMEVSLTERDGVTGMEVRVDFDSRDGMDRLLEMGMLEGMTEAVGQIDALLAEAVRS